MILDFIFRRRKGRKKTWFQTITTFVTRRTYLDETYTYDYHENEEGFMQRWLDTFLHKIGYLQFDDIHDQTEEENDDIEEENEDEIEDHDEHEEFEEEEEEEYYARLAQGYGAAPGSPRVSSGPYKIPSDSFSENQIQFESSEISRSFEATEGKISEK